MTTLVDGLGGEELGDTVTGGVDVGSKVAALWITGSITTQSNVNVAGTISGAGTQYILALSGTNIFASADIIGSGITNTDGGIHSVNYGAASPGSPGAYGAIVQAGRAGPLIATTGSIVFGEAFIGRDYIVTVSPESPTVDGIGSIVPYVLSGVTHATSGCTLTAQSGAAYNWTAVGI